MKKLGKILALVLSAALLCALFAGCSVEINVDGAAAAPAAPAAAFAQVDDTHWAGGSLTVKSVEYDAAYADQGDSRYVDSTLFGAVSKIVYDGGEIDVDAATQTAILTVDGVQYDLYNIAEDTSFTGDVVITLAETGATQVNSGAPFGADKSAALFGPFCYTPAIYISGGAYDEAKSVPAARIAGEVSDTEVNGLVFDSEGDYFSALYIADSEYTVNDADIRLVGRGGDDFNGWGAGIVALGSSVVNVNGSYIYGTGVLRSGLFTSGTAQVFVNDSVILAENEEDFVPYNTDDNYATPMMQQCPYALGIQGNIRASLACGSGCNTFTNSLVVSNGWAVLSTDSGRAGATALVSNAMVAAVGEASDEEFDGYDFTYDVDGKPWYVKVGRYGEYSGYIAYADSGVLDYAYGSCWYSPDYLGIVTSGTLTMADYCYGYSGRIGFLMHSGGGGSGTGTLTLSDSSFDVQNIFAVSQAQGSYTANISLDNVDVAMAKSGSDILFLQCDTDDNAGGPGNTSNTITDKTYDEYLALTADDVNSASGEPGASTLLVANSHIQGNIFNSTTGGSGIDVTLDAAEIDGAISSAWAYHVDADGNALDETEFVCDYYTGTADGSNGVWDYTMFLRLNAQPAPTRNNPISLTLTNGSKWMVTGDNYLSSLTLDDSSEISGMGLVMTVNGVETEIAAGSYSGEIVLSAGEAPDRGEGDAELKAPVVGEAAAVAASAEPVVAFEADLVIEPFELTDIGLSFSSIAYSFGDGTVSLFIADTSKQIDCQIVDGQWIMEGSDFVDDSIIANAKAAYEGGEAPAASGEASAESGYPLFDEYKQYLYDTLMKDSFWQGNEANLTAALDAATAPTDESIQNFTGSGDVDQAPEGVVFPMTYDVWFAEQ